MIINMAYVTFDKWTCFALTETQLVTVFREQVWVTNGSAETLSESGYNLVAQKSPALHEHHTDRHSERHFVR